VLFYFLFSWPFVFSTAFGLHFFCGGGYCGCVSLNIFSASFSWLSFALRRCNFRFWDRVNPAGHHRGMEYFGSAVLMVAVSSILVVLANSPKIIDPFLSSCMTTSAVPTLMMSFFVVLSVAAGVCPPVGLVGLGGRVVESRLEGGVNRAKLKFTKLITTTRRVSVRNNNESEREGAKTNRKRIKSVTHGFVLPRFGSCKPTPR
jgi:hypothetical protein